MITSSEIEQRRSPSELLEFVNGVKKRVRADKSEWGLGIQRKGNYKEFLAEIVPLSKFALWNYPETYKILPVLGNQAYDALVFDELGKEIERIEVKAPHDGKFYSNDAKQLISEGIGIVQAGNPSEDFDELFSYVTETCRNNIYKSYEDCVLLFAVEPLSPFPSYESQYERQIEQLASEIARFKFKAKQVFLLIFPDRVVGVRN